jgi:acyl-coenzyme A synthetase/AMP-(fatty) acid ligase
MQLVHVKDRRELNAQSWPLGAVRMTERFLPDEKAKDKQMEALREHVRGSLRGSKTPDRVAVWDDLPRTVTGKLLRRELQRAFSETS